MRKEFKLTQEDVNFVVEASKPVPAMFLSDGGPMFGTPQENANKAWQTLGKKYGFIWHTCEPVPGKNRKFITAEVIEKENKITDEQI